MIGYLQIIDHNAGRYSLRFPLTITPRYIPDVNVSSDARLTSETPVAALTLAVPGDDTATIGDLQPELAHANPQRQSVSMEIDIDAGAVVEQIISPYHPILVSETERGARIELRNQQSPPDRDFELSWAPIVKGEPTLALFREATDQGEHVLLMFMPPQETRPAITPREVIFVIDTSGSMSGESIDQARAALMNGLRTLRPTDRFTAIQFNSIHEALFDEPVFASEENLSRAQRYVGNLHATGGTEMLPALLTALSMPESEKHLRQVIFITDAAVGNEDQLMLAIRQHLGSARLFTVGIGSAPNGHFLRNAARTRLATARTSPAAEPAAVKRDWARIAIVAVAGLGLWQIASGTYIHAKAWLAQQLIASAWTRTLEGEREVKPWPWADTWPIARLQVIEKDVDLYVLADASGRSLAFGPGYVNGTAAIGEGNTVLAGHRDTHFAFLRSLQAGDEFVVQTADGRRRRFQLNQTHVIDSRYERLQFDESMGATITLLTCYPFDAIAPGGPLRYVAVAGIKTSPTT